MSAPGASAPGASVQVVVPTAAHMRALGERLATLLRPGDLVVLTGDLGAGKTTLTQGLGAALGVRGRVTSPTFVISRIHPSEVGGAPLVHVDAYRMSDTAEIADLDLDISIADSVTVVEWGSGLVEDLAPDRLELVLHRTEAAPPGADPDDPSAAVRFVTVTGLGPRWTGVDLAALG
ncbi:MAG: tRNA (adenosine(37)-N6)-threonylcarbamoyltransferase complex ATPase subunit type 1 TsaE [Sporichthyaceae bacterium]